MALTSKMIVRQPECCQSADVRKLMSMIAIDIAAPSPVWGGPNHERKGNCAKPVTIHCHTTHANRHNSIGEKDAGVNNHRLAIPVASHNALMLVRIKITNTVGSVCTQMPVSKGGKQAINTFNMHSRSARPIFLNNPVFSAKVNMSWHQ